MNYFCEKHNLFCLNVTRSTKFLPAHERHVQIFSYLFPLHYGCVFLVLKNGVYNLLLHITLKACHGTLYIRLSIFEQMKMFIKETINNKHWAPFFKIVTGYSDCRVYSFYCFKNYDNGKHFYQNCLSFVYIALRFNVFCCKDVRESL